MSETIDCPKCEHEHDPSGNHEEDEGEMECEECGHKFEVTVEYDPSYSTYCIVHEYGEYERVATRDGSMVVARFCNHCLCCELK